MSVSSKKCFVSALFMVGKIPCVRERARERKRVGFVGVAVFSSRKTAPSVTWYSGAGKSIYLLCTPVQDAAVDGTAAAVCGNCIFCCLQGHRYFCCCCLLSCQDRRRRRRKREVIVRVSIGMILIVSYLVRLFVCGPGSMYMPSCPVDFLFYVDCFSCVFFFPLLATFSFFFFR